MAEGSNLLISQLPASFAAIGEKHNNLVTLLRTMTGTGGCKVTFSENRIIISAPTASVAASITVPDPLTVGTIYNTTFNGGAIYSDTISSTTAAINYVGSDRIDVFGASHYLLLDGTSITRNMSIKEIDVCSGGVAKKMLIVASDPY